MSTTSTKPPDDHHPLVSELEVGDVIQTAGLEAMDTTEVRVVENRLMTNGYRYLGTEPVDRPGAIKRYPQRADIQVTRVTKPAQVEVMQFGVKVKYPAEAPFITTGVGGWTLTSARVAADGYTSRGAAAVVVSRRITPWVEVPAGGAL